MKRTAATLLATFVLVSLSLAAPKEKTFKGEIMDSQCAKMGSHAMMLKKEGMGDKNPNDPMAKKMCTQNCVKMGGKYVLFDAAHKKIYQLDDQTKPAEFAGASVKVKGTLDKSTKTIHVADIQPGS
ncbi:MAG: hypothetical protein ACM3SW_18835 [Actinomycetota bacterium]